MAAAGRRQRRRGRALAALAVAGALATAAGCASSGSGDDVTTLNFFQFKGEALEDFDAIIARFEDENPDVRVVQNQIADAETIIRTLLVKDKPPDVITLNANGGFGRLAEAGVFHDFRDDEVLASINPAVQEILDGLGTHGDEVNGLAYVNNANGIIYNTTIFAEQGLEVPTTWDELVAVCEVLEAAGITPFYGTLADAWTTLPTFNGLGAYVAEDGFFDRLRDEEPGTSFTDDFAEVLERQAELYGHMQDGYRGRTYDDGNAAFARGDAAMLLQGSWALNPIAQANPDVAAEIFPFPTDGADERLLVSGVDVAVTLPKDGAHHEEAMRFVEFLFRPDVVEEFAASQSMVPSVEGAELSEDPALQSVRPWFDEGRLAGFVDHQVPPSIPLDAITQKFLFDGDASAALATLDDEWRKVAARTIPVTGD